MPKLKTEVFNYKNKAGDIIEVISEASVTANGTFRLTIPDYLVKTAENLKIHPMRVNNKRSNKIFIQADTLKEVKNNMSHILKEHLSYTTEKSLVIRYEYTTSCHYYKDTEGNIHPNGVNIKEGNWHGPDPQINSSSRSFLVGFKARIYAKFDYFGKNHWTEYKGHSTDLEDIEILGRYGKLLSRFPRIYLEGEASGEIPYTEEHAKIFYEAMINLCKIADKLEDLFGDKDSFLEKLSKIKLLNPL
jgi:hypothetical protein